MWETFAIWGAVTLASYVYNKLNRPPPKRPESRLLDLDANLPRSQEGTPLPLIFGKVRVRPTIYWYGTPKEEYFDSPPRNRYGLDFLLGLGIPMTFPAAQHGNLGQLVYNWEPQLWNMFIGDSAAGFVPLSGGPPVSHFGICDVGLDQGGVGMGGQIAGRLTFYNGRYDQTLSNGLANFAQNPAWLNQYILPSVSDLTPIANSMQFNGEDGTLIPSYRDQILVSLTALGHDNGSLDDAFELGENASSIPDFAFEVSSYGPRIFSQPGANGLGEDADPIEVLWDILVSDWGKVAYPTLELDQPSFQTASNIVCAEGNGYSRAHYENEDAKTAIQGILKQVNGGIFADPTTGTIKIKLIRAEDTTTWPTFADGGAGIISVENYAVGNWPDTYNEVRLTYMSRAVGYLPRVARSIDPGNGYQASDGRRRVFEIEYPGVCTEENASKIAARDLGAVSRPLATARITLDRRGATLLPGDGVVLSWTQDNVVGMAFRVVSVDRGDLFDAAVAVDLVQDAFDTGLAGLPVPDADPVFLYPAPLTDRVLIEAPRFLAQQAISAGAIAGSADATRILALASQLGAYDEFGLAPITWDEISQSQQLVLPTTGTPTSPEAFQLEIGARHFKARAHVTTLYPRSLGPYDGTVGLFVSFDYGHQPPGAFVLESDVIARGANMILVGDELLNFLFWDDMGGGIFRLWPVYRGMVDTVPQTHAVGDEVWFVGSDDVGKRGWGGGWFGAVDCRAAARSHWRSGGPYQPNDVLARRYRPILPLRPQCLSLTLREAVVDGDGVASTLLGAPEYTELTVLDAGFDVRARRRDLSYAQLSIPADGDFASTQVGITYRVYAKKVTTGLVAEIFTLPDANMVGAAMAFGVGGAGYGKIDVGVETHRTMQPGDPSAGMGYGIAADMAAWAAAIVRVVAPRWRNLFTDPRLKQGALNLSTGYGWQAAAGDFVVASGANSIRRTSNGSYLLANNAKSIHADTTLDVSGYLPRGMKALIAWYSKNLVDTNDTNKVTIDALDAGLSVLATANATAAVSTTTFVRTTTSIAALPATTAKIHAKIDLIETAAGGGSSDPDSIVSDLELIVGQFNYDRLTNGSFDTASTTGWTVDSGAFLTPTTIASPSSTYLQGGANASNVIHQDKTLTTGYEYGTVVLRAWRAQTLASDAGTLELLVLDGGGATIASASTGSVSYATLNEWVPVRLSVDLPSNGNAVTIRVRFTATRTLGSGNSGACLDECVLTEHNQLEASTTIEAIFSSAVEQKLPTAWNLAHDAWPTLPRCDVFSGDATAPGADAAWSSGLGGFQYSDGSPGYPSAKLVGQLGAGVASTNAYGFARQSSPTYLTIRATDGSRYGRHGRARGFVKGFTYVVFYKVDERSFASACGLLGRYSVLESKGWGLYVDASGQPVAHMDDGTRVTATATGEHGADGALHMAAITWDPATELLSIDTENGRIASTSTAGLAEFFTAAADAAFQIGADGSGPDTIPGMIARVYRFVKPLAAVDVASLWTYATDPSGWIVSAARTTPVWCPGPPDADGETLALIGVDGAGVRSIPLAYHPTLAAAVDQYVGEGRGLALSRAIANLAPSFDGNDATHFVLTGAGTLTRGIVDATGIARGASLLSSSIGAGIRLELIPVTATATIRIVAYLRSSGSVSAVLSNASGTTKQTVALGAIGNAWVRTVVDFNAWDGSTGTCRIAFTVGATSATIAVTGACLVYQGTATADAPTLFHRDPATSTTNATTYRMGASLTAQGCTEGEVIVDALGHDAAVVNAQMVAALNNGSNNNDRKELYVASTTPAVGLAFYDGAGASSGGTAPAHSNATLWTGRIRWRRAGLLDNLTTPFGVVMSPGGAAVIKGATWTPTKVAPAWIDLGTGVTGTTPLAGYVRRVRATACEEKLA